MGSTVVWETPLLFVCSKGKDALWPSMLKEHIESAPPAASCMNFLNVEKTKRKILETRLTTDYSYHEIKTNNSYLLWNISVFIRNYLSVHIIIL